jgi:hypothetical protein
VSKTEDDQEYFKSETSKRRIVIQTLANPPVKYEDEVKEPVLNPSFHEETFTRLTLEKEKNVP